MNYHPELIKRWWKHFLTLPLLLPPSEKTLSEIIFYRWNLRTVQVMQKRLHVIGMVEVNVTSASQMFFTCENPKNICEITVLPTCCFLTNLQGNYIQEAERALFIEQLRADDHPLHVEDSLPVAEHQGCRCAYIDIFDLMYRINSNGIPRVMNFPNLLEEF